jgi:tyrosyl-tRNA synthetase
MKKMSKSDPDGAILISDSDEEIKRKIMKAWCPVPDEEESQ